RAVPPYAARGAAGAAVGAGMGILGVAGYVVSAVHGSRRRGYTDEFVLTPEDLNMPYEEVQFFTEDGISLTGWFIPQSSAGRPSRRILVFCHPYNNSKSNLLGVARGLWDRRHSIFMFDFRSFADAKTGQSVGYLEQRDAKAAVAAARRHGPKDAEIGLLGASMGGAVALIIGHGEDVGAVGVATDCAFARLSDVLESRICATLRFPQPLAAFTVDLASHLNLLLHGYSFKAVSPVDAVEHGPRAGQVPLLLIHADNDEVVTVSQAHAIHSAALAPKELIVVQHCHHVGCFFKDRARYLKLVADFFDSAFAAAERRRIGEGREVLPTPE
ncbi:yfhR, partial [Symbiodinium sp. CCMP2456]